MNAGVSVFLSHSVIHHGKRTLGRMNFTTRFAGRASMLRHFHYWERLPSINPCNMR